MKHVYFLLIASISLETVLGQRASFTLSASKSSSLFIKSDSDTKASWIAFRIFPSAHINPVFVLVNNKPIHVQKSAEWCLQALDKCGKMNQKNIRAEKRSAAEALYDNTRKIYDEIVKDSAK
jgi:hypothetical protein